MIVKFLKNFLNKVVFFCRAYHGLLAVPVIKGVKSEKEKFAGGKMTTTVETLIPSNGRGVQAATSHHLGTNFSKMFGIEYEGTKQRKFNSIRRESEMLIKGFVSVK